jgi:hypothetical protein
MQSAIFQTIREVPQHKTIEHIQARSESRMQRLFEGLAAWVEASPVNANDYCWFSVDK